MTRPLYSAQLECSKYREEEEGRILDLYITNRPALVKTITAVPSISDHERAIVADSDIDLLFKSGTHSWQLIPR